MGHYSQVKLTAALESEQPLLFLTGAGFSKASGVPDFRDPASWWTIQGRPIEPRLMATRDMFRLEPRMVWSWYLYRRSVVHRSKPNIAHESLVTLEKKFGSRFLLITQNVDGLHLRAGNTREHTYEVHGNLDYHRCSNGCLEPFYLGEDLLNPEPELISSEMFDRLRCPRCRARSRPHVLWFDEVYDEYWFRWDSSLKAAAQAGLLAVIGSSGSTNLPRKIADLASQNAFVINVDTEDNWFGQLAVSRQGMQMREPALTAVPRLVDLICQSAYS